MTLQELIGGYEDFERELLIKGDDESLWLSYIDAVAGDFPRSVFVLERAVCALPASSLLWNAYLSLPWGHEKRPLLIKLYKRALSLLRDTPSYWFALIDLLLLHTSTDPESSADLMHALDSALVCLDSSHHSKLWTIYLNLVESKPSGSHISIINTQTSISIYKSLFEALSLSLAKLPINQHYCILKIAELGDFSTANGLLRALPPKQDLEFVHQYMQILSGDPKFTDDAYFEHLAQTAILDHPKSQYKVLIWLAEYHSDRKNVEKARHLFSLALKSGSTIHDVSEAFDRYTNWEENQLERCVQANINPNEVEVLMARFEAFLDRHKLLLNDVLIRENPNCVDYWIDRFGMLQHANDRIQAYVQALRAINPLEAVSARENSLVTIWSAYADVYLESGDIKSAELIYSRAVKTPFRNMQDLADLYMRWTELKLGISDEAALSHIEAVLFLDTDVQARNERNLQIGSNMSQSGNPVAQSGQKSAQSGKNENNGSQTKKDTETKNVVALSRSLELWRFYLDLLQAVPESGPDRVETAYRRMMSLQIISLQMLFDYGNFLIKKGNRMQCYSVYEASLEQFHSLEAQALIWTEYLGAYMQDEPFEAVQELHSRCFRTQIPEYTAYRLFSQYAQFCCSHGKLVQASKVLQSGIEYLSKADTRKYRSEERKQMSIDKSSLYAELLVLLVKINDDSLLRQAYSSALEDSQLFLADTVEFGKQFVVFERGKSEFLRVRRLFSHITGLGHPSLPLFKQVWDDWELFEAEHGDEKSFKEVLREKRKLLKRLGDVAELKAEINPIGFVKAETSQMKPKLKAEPAGNMHTEASNPDAIELDMDDM